MKMFVLLIIFILNLIFIPFKCNAQEIDPNKFPVNDKGVIEFSGIIENNLSKDKMFSNAKEWIAKNFVDYKKVIQFEDKEEGKIIIKGVSNVSYIHESDIHNTSESIKYTITIECKDHKYRYKIEDIIIEEVSTFMGMKGKPIYLTPINHIEKYNNKFSEYKPMEEDLKRQRDICLAEKNRKNQDKCFEETRKAVLDLSLLKKEISSQLAFYNEEFDILNSLINSLKSSMSINSEW